MAKAVNDPVGGDAASATPEAPAPEGGDAAPEPQDPEASWQRFRDESKTIFKEAITEWADERDGALGHGAQAGGADGPGRAGGSSGAGNGSGAGAGNAATTRGAAAGEKAAKAPGGFFTELGFVVFGKPKRK